MIQRLVDKLEMCIIKVIFFSSNFWLRLYDNIMHGWLWFSAIITKISKDLWCESQVAHSGKCIVVTIGRTMLGGYNT